MMFSIDLLQGKGLPQKTDLKRLALKAVGLLIPVLAVTAFAASYQQNRIQLQGQKAVLLTHQQEIERHAKDVAEYNRIDTQISDLRKCLGDISKALSYRIQVSDMLVELVGALPENVFLYEMKLDRNSVVEKTQQADAEAVKQRLIVRRKLNLTLCGYDAKAGDSAVEAYLDRLKRSALLKNVFEQIKPTVRQQGQVDGKDAVYYEIECLLKEQK
ncbi:MAG: hypothetical protein L0Y36_04035 [Planctomycetales bacterium]|nr:hypothetical protein [Planctomycetales bacterium]